jgi:hypothetical protein
MMPLSRNRSLLNDLIETNVTWNIGYNSTLSVFGLAGKMYNNIIGYKELLIRTNYNLNYILITRHWLTCD